MFVLFEWSELMYRAIGYILLLFQVAHLLLWSSSPFLYTDPYVIVWFTDTHLHPLHLTITNMEEPINRKQTEIHH